MRYLKITVFVLGFLLLASNTHAAASNYVNVVNPIRGEDFWEEKFEPTVTVKGELAVLKNLNIPATWLIRPDVFASKKLLDVITTIPAAHEKGIFLEVTPTWTNQADVKYRQSQSWHFAESIFLTGYTQQTRIKLIDTAFESFKLQFGYYPTSVGAWWIDAYSLDYMQDKYGITSALVVADQYSTDHYQIWGQYWSTPYYPSKTNALFPAQTMEEKLPVVITQWAARDPVNGYGKGVEESTLSVQPNDYIDFHDLGIDYFTRLVDVYTKQELNSFNELVVGLENSYDWAKYKSEYQQQMEVLSQKSKAGQFQLTTQNTFASWYLKAFPDISPSQIIVASDPLQSTKKSIWFMNPYYRAGLFINNNEVVFRDIRQYIAGSKELCFDTVCKSINFASNATRVLDEVTNGQKLLIDEGVVKNIQVSKQDDKYIVEYLNQTDNKQTIEFLPRDIGINGNISSIDGIILKALEDNLKQQNVSQVNLSTTNSSISITRIVLNIFKFSIFWVIALLIPGLVLFRYSSNNTLTASLFLTTTIGMVVLTLVTFISGLINSWWLVIGYLGIILILLVLNNSYINLIQLLDFSTVRSFIKDKSNLAISILILSGTIFQALPTFRSGSLTQYGLGFWGPNAHDAVWHLALVNQLSKSIPPENPVFAGSILANYHYFYDVLIVATNKLTAIPTIDLIFRFYPILFSLLLGLGTYLLAMKLFKSKQAAFFSIYLVYFSGSFGWIVEFLRSKVIGGESAFWANQSISFNLNPPFAVSLIIIIALIYLLSIYMENSNKKLGLLLAIIFGSLVGFKAYGAILALGSLLVIAIIRLILKRDLSLLGLFIGSLIMAVLVILPNYQVNQLYQASQGTFILAPFWFIHSMIDAPDRVGLIRLTLARTAGLEQGNWLKFFAAEFIGLVIFLVGNLGVRVVSVGLFLIKGKDIALNSWSGFIFLVALFSFLLPLLIIQVGNPWNVIQFMYYGLYIASLSSGVVLYWLIKKLRIVGAGIVFVILLFAPINALATANSYLYPMPHAVLSVQEFEALNFLLRQPEGVILTPPFNSLLRKNLQAPIPISFYETTSYVAAFSNHPTFVEDEIQQQILQTNAKDRITQSNYFFRIGETNWSKNFLKENNIRYIYLPKVLKLPIETSKLGLEIVFENNGAIVYKVQ